MLKKKTLFLFVVLLAMISADMLAFAWDRNNNNNNNDTGNDDTICPPEPPPGSSSSSSTGSGGSSSSSSGSSSSGSSSSGSSSSSSGGSSSSSTSSGGSSSSSSGSSSSGSSSSGSSSSSSSGGSSSSSSGGSSSSSSGSSSSSSSGGQPPIAPQVTSGGSSRLKGFIEIPTHTIYLMFVPSPKLEIVTIDMPSVMYVDEPATVEVTIKNNGDKPYDVNVSASIFRETTAITRSIDSGEKYTYRFDITPGKADIGSHTARFSITSDGKDIERSVPFSVIDRIPVKVNETQPASNTSVPEGNVTETPKTPTGQSFGDYLKSRLTFNNMYLFLLLLLVMLTFVKRRSLRRFIGVSP